MNAISQYHIASDTLFKIGMLHWLQRIPPPTVDLIAPKTKGVLAYLQALNLSSLYPTARKFQIGT